MIALTKWLGGTWEPCRHGGWGFGINFRKPRTKQTLIDPSLIQGVEAYVPWAEKAVGTPPECCHVFLTNGKSFKAVGNYREIAKLAGVQWQCQYCNGQAEACPHCGAPKEQ